MMNTKNSTGAADKVVPVSVFGEIADTEPLILCRGGLVGWLSAMPVYAICRGIRAAKRLYRGIPTPLTGDNERPAAGRRDASKVLLLLLLCLAIVPALMFAGDAIALPFGAFGVVAPQFGLAVSIPVVGAALVGAGVVGLAAYGVYELCSGESETPKKRKNGKAE